MVEKGCIGNKCVNNYQYLSKLAFKIYLETLFLLLITRCQEELLFKPEKIVAEKLKFYRLKIDFTTPESKAFSSLRINCLRLDFQCSVFNMLQSLKSKIQPFIIDCIRFDHGRSGFWKLTVK